MSEMSEVSESTARSAPKEVDIQLNLYSLSIDTERDEKLHGLKVGSGSPSNNGDGVYNVHVGRLLRRVSVKAGGEILKLYGYKGNNLVINGEEMPSPVGDKALIEIINDSLGGNVKILNEPSFGYIGPDDEKNAIIFVDCRSVLADYRLFPFMRKPADGSSWPSTYQQIFHKTYSGEVYHLAGEVARKAYARICEDPSFSMALKPEVIYVAFLVSPESRVPISLFIYEPGNSMIQSVPMLFGGKWANSPEGAKLKTIAPSETWDEYIEDIGKKYVAISQNEVLDWTSFERAWKNSIFSTRPN